MTIFGDVRIAIPREQQEPCPRCAGRGQERTPPYGQVVRCDEVGCVDGMIAFKVRRASKNAIRKAREEQGRRNRR